jgi:hypothetical protein
MTHLCVIKLKQQKMITEKMLPAERRLLSKRLELYGTIADCSMRTGIHRSTIARVVKTGEGSQTVIAKLREYLNDDTSTTNN